MNFEKINVSKIEKENNKRKKGIFFLRSLRDYITYLRYRKLFDSAKYGVGMTSMISELGEDKIRKILSSEKGQKNLEKGITSVIERGFKIEPFIKFASKETFQNSMLNGLIKRIEKGEYIPSDYLPYIRKEEKILNFLKKEKRNEIQNALSKRIEEGKEFEDYNFLVDEEIIKQIRETKQEKVRKGIVKRVEKNFDIEDILPYATKETLQSVFWNLLPQKIEKGEYFEKYIPYIDEKTLQWIKTNQEGIRKGILERIELNEDIDAYIPLSEPQVFQSALREGIEKRIKEKLSIKKFISYINKEDLQELKDSLQDILREAITDMVSSGKNIDEYSHYVKKEVFRSAFHEGIKRRIEQNLDIQKYSTYFDEATFEFIKKIKREKK